MEEKSLVGLIISNNKSDLLLQVCQIFRESNIIRQDCFDVCAKIKNKLNYEIKIISPSSNFYKIEDIEELEKDLLFVPVDWQCFILQSIDRMPPVVANRILKKLEDLPNKTHIIFTASNEYFVQPTIRSRVNFCKYLTSIDKSEISKLENLFLGRVSISDISELDAILAETSMNSLECQMILERLVSKLMFEENIEAEIKRKIFSSALDTVPTVNFLYFWRGLFLKLL